jgi:hypothetical protein
VAAQCAVARLTHGREVGVVVQLGVGGADGEALFDAEEVTDHEGLVGAAAQYSGSVVPIQDPSLLGRFDRLSDGRDGPGSLARFALRRVVEGPAASGAANHVLAVRRHQQRFVGEAAGAWLPRDVVAGAASPSPGRSTTSPPLSPSRGAPRAKGRAQRRRRKGGPDRHPRRQGMPDELLTVRVGVEPHRHSSKLSQPCACYRVIIK